VSGGMICIPSVAEINFSFYNETPFVLNPENVDEIKENI
jgi:hypothetical protein